MDRFRWTHRPRLSSIKRNASNRGLTVKNILLKPFKTNARLAQFVQSNPNLNSVNGRRSAVKIAIIDDQPFLPQTNLQAYGYTVQPLGDIKSVSEVKDYHIVLCDVMGVGRHFDANAQGATLISEIKNSFPEKIVIAYTGGAMNDPAVKAARERADLIIKKDVDAEEWISKLDSITMEAVSPYVIWQKIRRRFVELDVDTRNILILEDAFVSSVISGQGFSALTRLASDMNVSKDVRSIIQGLASSAIFAALSA